MESLKLSNCFDNESKSLILTHQDLRTISADIIESYAEYAYHIDFSHNRLTDLTWIREFYNCSELILDNNRLAEISLRRLIGKFENVKILWLNKNEFADLHLTIEHLSRLFPNLEHLSLHGNAICPDGLALCPFSDYTEYTYVYYRSFVISAFPKLKFLDHSSTKYTAAFSRNVKNSTTLNKKANFFKRNFNKFWKNTLRLGHTQNYEEAEYLSLKERSKMTT